MVQSGWAAVFVFEAVPQRNGTYVDAETAATGVCGGSATANSMLPRGSQ
jgi:hypothetical protein